MRYSYFRRPKTTNEIRQYFDAINSNFIKIRAKRAPNNLPNSWDDIRARRKVDTRRQKLQSRVGYYESIRFFSVEDFFSDNDLSVPWN